MAYWGLVETNINVCTSPFKISKKFGFGKVTKANIGYLMNNTLNTEAFWFVLNEPLNRPYFEYTSPLVLSTKSFSLFAK